MPRVTGLGHADAESVDHEIALMRGRPATDDSHLSQQISMRAASLDDLRVFHRRLLADGYRIEGVVNQVGGRQAEEPATIEMAQR
jgi:hypothetical protein